MEISSYSKFEITRPILFLCGPYLEDDTDKKDRRNIVRDYMIKKAQTRNRSNNIDYQPIPIIVDQIFNAEYINSNVLNLSMMEEIVSAISFRTYVFLDTMSTSMELGLFSNCGVTNQVRVFLPDKKRDIGIGKFIIESINLNENVKKLEYKSTIRNGRYVYFFRNIIPKNVQNLIDIDLIEIKKQALQMNIQIDNNRVIPKNHQTISFSSEIKTLECFINFRPLFYLITTILKDYHKGIKDLGITDMLVSDISRRAKIELMNMYIFNEGSTENCSTRLLYLFNMPNINVITSLNNDFSDLVRHIIHIVKLIEISIESNRKSVKVIDRQSFEKVAQRRNSTSKFKVDDIFELTFDENQIIRSYIHNPQKYLKSFIITQKGKKKKIVTYSSNEHGFVLRNLHIKMSQRLRLFIPSSEFSYAYKPKSNISKCVSNHIDSTSFQKFDISCFFNSIKLKNLDNILKCLFSLSPANSYLLFEKIAELQSKLDDELNPIIASKISSQILKNKRRLNDGFNTYISSKHLIGVLKVCFVSGSLPIGFVTSPILSDLYLNFFDANIGNQNIVYSRYADDILVSCTSIYDKNEIFSLIEYGLKILHLELNNSKYIEKELNQMGDSIKFLGINIVKTETRGRITISDKYLRLVSLEYANYRLDPSKKGYHELSGKINYIRFISQGSYLKLKTLVRIKLKISPEDVFEGLIKNP